MAVNVIANLGTGTATGGAGTDTLLNFENLTGGSGNDTLTGNNLDNIINGGAGNDIINGGAGNDYLLGGAGINTYFGGTGNDLMESTSGTNDTFLYDLSLGANSISSALPTSTTFVAASDFSYNSDVIKGFSIASNDVLELDNIVDSNGDTFKTAADLDLSGYLVLVGNLTPTGSGNGKIFTVDSLNGDDIQLDFGAKGSIVIEGLADLLIGQPLNNFTDLQAALGTHLVIA